jgi:hypothetical protein
MIHNAPVTEESGQVREALEVSGPLKKRGFVHLNPALLGPCFCREQDLRTGAFQGPKHPAD